MLKNYKNFKQILVICISITIIIILITIYFYKNNKEVDYSYLEIQTNEEIDKEIKEEKIVVHITGQVVNQGIVELKKDSRIIDAVEAAGGITEDADLNKINLAYILEDGVKIYIPSINDKDEEIIQDDVEINVTNSNSNNKDTKIMVNINTASNSELQQIPGVGQVIADRIINYRKEKGKFKDISEIKEVSGIGDAKYEKIKQYIYVK